MATLSEFLGYLAQAPGETVVEKVEHLIQTGRIAPCDQSHMKMLAIRIDDCLAPSYMQASVGRIQPPKE